MPGKTKKNWTKSDLKMWHNSELSKECKSKNLFELDVFRVTGVIALRLWEERVNSSTLLDSGVNST